MTEKKGVDVVVEMLNHMELDQREKLLKNLAERDPTLTQELREKSFNFDSLLKVSSLKIQKLLREIPTPRLALALRKCSDEVKAYILQNMSQRAAGTLREEIINSPPRPISEVNRAQREILEVLKTLSAGDLPVT